MYMHTKAQRKLLVSGLHFFNINLKMKRFLQLLFKQKKRVIGDYNILAMRSKYK